MTKTTTAIVGLAGLTAVAGLVAVVASPAHRDLSPLRLKILSQAMEQGKPVVFFRLEGGLKRTITIDTVTTIAATKRYRVILTEELFDGPEVRAPARLWLPVRAPFRSEPWDSQNGVGVLAPPDALAWRLAITWHLKPGLAERARSAFERLKSVLAPKSAPGGSQTRTPSLVQAGSVVMNSWRRIGFSQIESDTITNPVAIQTRNER